MTIGCSVCARLSASEVRVRMGAFDRARACMHACLRARVRAFVQSCECACLRAGAPVPPASHALAAFGCSAHACTGHRMHASLRVRACVGVHGLLSRLRTVETISNHSVARWRS
eukprot:2229292-Pleurochrysis_carterae.AAC.2